jgi:hypothetical protein
VGSVWAAVMEIPRRQVNKMHTAFMGLNVVGESVPFDKKLPTSKQMKLCHYSGLTR